MSIANLKSLAGLGFNGDMQLGLIASTLLNIVGMTGAQRRSSLQSLAAEIEALSVADIKQRKIVQRKIVSIRKPDVLKVTGDAKATKSLKAIGKAKPKAKVKAKAKAVKSDSKATGKTNSNAASTSQPASV